MFEDTLVLVRIVLRSFLFKEVGGYLWLGTIEVDYHFSDSHHYQDSKDATHSRPRHSMDQEKRSLHEDVSLTFREPYPQVHEIGLPNTKYEMTLQKKSLTISGKETKFRN